MEAVAGGDYGIQAFFGRVGEDAGEKVVAAVAPRAGAAGDGVVGVGEGGPEGVGRSGRASRRDGLAPGEAGWKWR